MSLLDNIKKITSIACNLKILLSKNKIDDNIKNKIVNQVFNNKLEKSNDTKFCDAVRKEKQKQIEELKNA